MTAQICAIRGPVLIYTDEPFSDRPDGNINYEPDAIIMMDEGKITDVGPAYRFTGKLPKDSLIEKFTNCRIIKVIKS